MKTKSMPAFAVMALGAVVAGYWYFSPYLMLHQMKSAAQAQNAVAFNAYVDYPRVRDSIKVQLNSLMNDRIETSGQDEPAFAALGQAMGAMIASKMVDTLVQPETVMNAMREGRFGEKDEDRKVEPASSEAGKSESDTEPAKQDWTLDRVGTDKALAFTASSDDPNNLTQQRVSIGIERSGFATWKVTEVRLPAAMLK